MEAKHRPTRIGTELRDMMLARLHTLDRQLRSTHHVVPDLPGHGRLEPRFQDPQEVRPRGRKLLCKKGDAPQGIEANNLEEPGRVTGTFGALLTLASPLE
eukprot:1932379-Pyramimonas_sp.AAC.1